MRNKKLWITGLMLGFMCLAPAMDSQAVDNFLGVETVYAAQSQTDRWESAGGDVWRLKTGDKQGYVSNAWFQDLDGSWYMINADGTMLSGLITDQSTGKSYLMNIQHDGTFGKMLVTDGVYNLNGVNVYLTFNQNHDGAYGAVTSGLSEARSAGVAEKALASIPTDSIGTSSGTGSQNNNQDAVKEPVSDDVPGTVGNSKFHEKNINDKSATGSTGLRN